MIHPSHVRNIHEKFQSFSIILLTVIVQTLISLTIRKASRTMTPNVLAFILLR